MKIGNICNRNAVVAEDNSDALMAAQLMRQHDVSAVVIVKNTLDGSKPIGIVSDHDLVIKVLAENRLVKEISLHEIMTTDLVCLRDDDEIIETIRLMCLEDIRRAPVIDENGNLIGILTIDDLFAKLADEVSNFASIFCMGLKEKEVLQFSQDNFR